MKPQDWLAYMEKKRNELENAGHEMDDETFFTHVMASLPQEEYQATILTLKAKLRNGDLTIEEAETLLDDKYEAMKEVQGWTEEGDELALLVGKPCYKKTFKGQCGYCGKYGHKAGDCHERKANLENKKIRHNMDKGNLSLIRTRSLFGNRVILKEKGSLTFQRLNVLIVINMDTLPKTVPTRKIKQV